MKPMQCLMLLIFLLMASAATGEEIFDGSKTLLCASIEAIDCASGEACASGRPEAIGAPQFLRIDFANKEIIGPKQTTRVLHTLETEDQTLLQGTELNMGWVFALDRATGKFTATLTDQSGAFVIFGACTPL
ncbi:MAG TPA: hypothetical protein DDY20_06515 [Desulfobulbaceae bacterium]|nr:hypothetical protein [Desulfobulbaceae bacterium]